jgi:hypothetical protein
MSAISSIAEVLPVPKAPVTSTASASGRSAIGA